MANYLGGDTVSGLLVAGLHEKEELGLFIDIGTNGEMVLGNQHFLVAGAGRRTGIGRRHQQKWHAAATAGAVDSVVIAENELVLTTIGGQAAGHLRIGNC